jgi:hypothetical protein
MRKRVGGRRDFLEDEHIPAVLLEPHGVCLDVSQDSIKVVFVNAQKVAVVLTQHDGGGARRVVNQRQLAEVVALLQGGDHPLAVDHHVHRPLQNDVPRVALVALVEYCKLANTLAPPR